MRTLLAPKSPKPITWKQEIRPIRPLSLHTQQSTDLRVQWCGSTLEKGVSVWELQRLDHGFQNLHTLDSGFLECFWDHGWVNACWPSKKRCFRIRAVHIYSFTLTSKYSYSEKCSLFSFFFLVHLSSSWWHPRVQKSLYVVCLSLRLPPKCHQCSKASIISSDQMQSILVLKCPTQHTARA